MFTRVENLRTTMSACSCDECVLLRLGALLCRDCQGRSCCSRSPCAVPWCRPAPFRSCPRHASIIEQRSLTGTGAAQEASPSRRRTRRILQVLSTARPRACSTISSRATTTSLSCGYALSSRTPSQLTYVHTPTNKGACLYQLAHKRVHSALC
jgi:hypothetical protein